MSLVIYNNCDVFADIVKIKTLLGVGAQLHRVLGQMVQHPVALKSDGHGGLSNYNNLKVRMK